MPPASTPAGPVMPAVPSCVFSAGALHVQKGTRNPAVRAFQTSGRPARPSPGRPARPSPHPNADMLATAAGCWKHHAPPTAVAATAINRRDQQQHQETNEPREPEQHGQVRGPRVPGGAWARPGACPRSWPRDRASGGKRSALAPKASAAPARSQQEPMPPPTVGQSPAPPPCECQQARAAPAARAGNEKTRKGNG
jgi:hypothetical protein